jgi:NAD(P)-dependent dehydrogenase (short-subunit alcohol dehydrogenase family)
MSLLKNKIAIVTGGGSGIGLATAKRFVEEGTYVFIAGRRRIQALHDYTLLFCYVRYA